MVHMSVSNTKKLEAAHHRWQRKILKISWNDMTTNKTVRETTAGQDTLESIIRERRLRWFPMGTRMLHQRWIDVEHRRRRCVEKTLDLQIGTTSKRRRRIDVAVSTHSKLRS